MTMTSKELKHDLETVVQGRELPVRMMVPNSKGGHDQFSVMHVEVTEGWDGDIVLMHAGDHAAVVVGPKERIKE